MNSGYTETTNKRGADALGYQDPTAGKRIRTTQTPSKVIHVRNLPADCTEADLLAIASPFGQVVNILMLKGKGQALVQMQDQYCATSLVDSYALSQPFIRGNTVYFQYSDRGEITPAQGQNPSNPNNMETPNTILLVNVSNLIYPITIDILYQVFSKYGAILKIVIFSKSGTFQSLIQFADLAAAVNARTALDGQHIYVGCCTLRIQYSKLKHLDVKYNNEKSRDYTNPSLPAGSVGGSAPGSTNPLGLAGGVLADPSMSYLSQYTGTTAQTQANPYLAQYGNMAGVPGMMGGGGAGGSVLIVSGLNTERVTPDVLFVLFGVYGDVNRVKILFNKRDTALIQMATPQQAELAISHLNGLNLYGSVLHVNLSKHQTINVVRDPAKAEEAQFTKGFTNSPMHRYQKAGSKNFQHICPPTPTLHLSNLSPSLDEPALRGLFSSFGTVQAFKYFPNDQKMALIQMSSVQEASEALIALHNYKAEETAPYLRVSFAKTQIKETAAV